MRGGASEWSFLGEQQVEWMSEGHLMLGEFSASVFHLNVLHLWGRETILIFHNTSQSQEKK